MRKFFHNSKIWIQKSVKGITKSEHFWFLLIIFILGLIPILWYRPGTIAIGHDMGYPLNPAHWFGDRLSTWSERLNFGSDQSVLMGSVILHGFEFLITAIVGNVALAQVITYVFWFELIGISMYLFIVTLLKQQNKYPALFASILYMFNLFFLQAWFIAERNKFAVLAALPLVLLILVKVLRDRYPILKGAAIIGLIYLLFNGGGSIPLFGSTLLILPIALVLFGAHFIKTKQDLWRTIKFLGLTLVITIALNLFWILPQLFTLRYSFSVGLDNAGGVSGNKSWIDEISQNASYGNLLRLQGFPDWSQEHMYAPTYLNNPLFIIASFGFIFVILLGIIYKKTKEEHLVFTLGLLSILVTMVFAAGSNGPFGDIYVWLVDNVPFFVIFRTPFYKFAGGIVFGAALILGVTLPLIGKNLGAIAERLKWFSISAQRHITVFATSVAIAGLILYAHPFLTGSFFIWNKPVSTMVTVPQYVFDYDKYLTTESLTTGNILIVPDIYESNSLDITNWNYFSLDPVPALISNRTHVYGGAESSYVQGSRRLISDVYDNLLTESSNEETLQLLGQLNIDNILLRKDLISFRNATITDASKWETVLNRSPYIRKEKEFGDWILYSVAVRSKDIVSYSQAHVINAPVSQLGEVYRADLLNPNQVSIFIESEKSLNAKVEADLSKTVARRTAQITPEKGNIRDGEIVYQFETTPGQYEIIAKQYDLNELWYRLILNRRGTVVQLIIERPKTEIFVNDVLTTIEEKRQMFEFTPQTKLEKIVINSTILNVPGSIPENNELFVGVFQTNSNQLSISYTNNSLLKEARNILLDPSFEVGPWTGAQICGGPLLPRNVSATRVSEKVDGSSSAFLSAQSGTIGCLIQNMQNLDKTKLYNLSFSYKNQSGNPLRYCILRRDYEGSKIIDKGCLEEDYVEKVNTWSTTSFDFSPTTAQDHILHFYGESDQKEASANFLDNIALSEYTLLSLGTYRLDTGIEIAFFSNLYKPYETRGNLTLDANTVLKTQTQSGFDSLSFISDSLFEKTLWGGVNLCGGDSTKANISVMTSTDAVTGLYSVKLSAKDGTACIYNPIRNFKKSLIYKFSFSYKTLSGAGPQFCALVNSPGSSRCAPQVNLPIAKEWTTYETMIQTSSDTNDVILHFYSPSIDGQITETLFDDLKVEAVYNPIQNIFLSQGVKVDDSVSKITSTKRKQWNYSVEVANISENGNIVELRQTFSPFWVMEKDKATWIETQLNLIKESFTFLLTKKEPNDLTHLHSNGIFNAWYVSENGSYTIYYLPQYLFIIGSALSLTGLITLLIFVNKKTTRSILSVIILYTRKLIALINSQAQKRYDKKA